MNEEVQLFKKRLDLQKELEIRMMFVNLLEGEMKREISRIEQIQSEIERIENDKTRTSKTESYD